MTIYFDNKPLILCDSIDAATELLRQQAGTVYLDQFSPQAVKETIENMELPKVQAAIFLHPDLEALIRAFQQAFTTVKAGGGLVLNPQNEVLMIFRRGTWDLPKGKLDKGETIEACAVREVEEETGIRNIRLGKHLLTTYHTYHDKKKFVLKESHWFRMTISDEQPLIPQTEEDIDEARWVNVAATATLRNNMLSSIKDVLDKAALPT